MQLTTRKMPLNLSGPATLNAEARTVMAVMATEAPVRVFDWDRGVVNEVLLMSGATCPPQVPLLDSHDRGSVETVLGSATDITVQGDRMTGMVGFSSVARGEDALVKVQEGHLTDFSIGYTVEEAVFVPEGQNQTIQGKIFQGPVKVCTGWTVKELSICPIGADARAKARMEMTNMDEINLQAERTRSADIMALGQEFGMMDQAREAVTSGTSVQDFQTVVLKSVRDNRSDGPAFRVEAGATDDEKFRTAAEESLLIRGGVVPVTENDLAALSLRELAKNCLVRAGHRVSGGNVLDLVGRALTSSDFPKILANSANKSLLIGFEQAEETWQVWCATGTATDFKAHSVVRPSEIGDLQEVPEMGEYPYADRSEAQEEFSLVTYGNLFGISRQAIINDDLGALTTIPQAHGEAVNRKIGDVAYSVLVNNAAMGDGVSLFHADHANVPTSAGAVSISTLAEGIATMKLQKDILGVRTLNIRPQFFMASVAREGVCEQLFLSAYEGTQADPTKANPYAGNYFTRVYDARLDLDSPTAWYLAGPKGKTVTMYFLNGIQTPYLETREGFTKDGVEYKVRIDCAGKAVDWRALYRNEGV